MQAPFDMQGVRGEFPVTGQYLYFDSAHQAPLSRGVRAGFERFLDEGLLTAGPKRRWLDRIAGVREQAARLVGADAAEIAFTKNTSEGLNIAANALPLAAGDNVLLVEGDHPNNTYAWLNLQRKGVEVRFVPPGAGPVDASTFASRIDGRTRAISLSHVTSDSGHRYDLASIGELCRGKGIHLVVDAIQSLGTLAVDVRRMGIAMLASGCHKGLLVPQGLGILYVRRDLCQLQPVYLAGSAVASPSRDANGSLQGAVLHDDARRFEPGNLNLPHLHALAASLALIDGWGVDNIERHVMGLGDRLIAHLDRLGVGLLGPRAREQRSHILVLDLPADPWIDYLATQQVRVSRQRGGVRVSFAIFNTDDEVDQLAGIIAAGPR